MVEAVVEAVWPKPPMTYLLDTNRQSRRFVSSKYVICRHRRHRSSRAEGRSARWGSFSPPLTAVDHNNSGRHGFSACIRTPTGCPDARSLLVISLAPASPPPAPAVAATRSPTHSTEPRPTMTAYDASIALYSIPIAYRARVGARGIGIVRAGACNGARGRRYAVATNFVHTRAVYYNSDLQAPLKCTTTTQRRFFSIRPLFSSPQASARRCLPDLVRPTSTCGQGGPLATL